MKTLILGSNSFSGTSFAAYSLKQGVNVIGTSRSDELVLPYACHKWVDQSGSNGTFSFRKIDLNHNLDELADLIDDEKPDSIVNFAAQSMVGQSWDHPQDWMMTNAVSTTNLFNMLRHRLGNFGRYVHVTTPEVYGSTDGWINEDAYYNPSTPYAVSRAAGDMSLDAYVKAYGIPALKTRAANVYGPGQPIYRIISRALYFFKTGQQLELHGGGASERSFIHMDDVSDATWKIINNGKIGETYHISTNDIVTVKELTEKMCDVMGVAFEDHVKVVGERLGKDGAYKLATEKIRSELGWNDVVSLEQGIHDCVKWVEKFEHELAKLPQSYIHKK